MNPTLNTSNNNITQEKQSFNIKIVILTVVALLVISIMNAVITFSVYQNTQSDMQHHNDQPQEYYKAPDPFFRLNQNGTYTISSGYKVSVQRQSKVLHKKECSITILDKHTAATSGYCSYGKGTEIWATADDTMRVHVGNLTDQKLFEGEGYVSIIELNDNIIGKTEDISLRKPKVSETLTKNSFLHGNMHGQVLENTYGNPRERISVTNIKMIDNYELGSPVYNSEGQLVGMIIGKNDERTGVMNMKSILQKK